MVYNVLILDAFGDSPGQSPPACAQRRLGIIIQNNSESSSVPFAVQNLSSPKSNKKKGQSIIQSLLAPEITGTPLRVFCHYLKLFVSIECPQAYI